MQKLTTPLLPIPIYALEFDRGNPPSGLNFEAWDLPATPTGDMALDEANASSNPPNPLRVLLVRKEHLSIFGRGRKHSLKHRFDLITLQDEQFLLLEDFLDFVGTMRLEPGTIAHRMRRRILAPFFVAAQNQAFIIPPLKREGEIAMFLQDPLLFSDIAGLPRPAAYVTSHHHKELPGVFTPAVQRQLAKGEPFSPTPIQEPDLACDGKGIAIDYSGVKTEDQLRNPTEEDLHPRVVNNPKPAPKLVPADKAKPGTPGNFVIPIDKTGAHPFAHPSRPRIFRMDDSARYLVLYGRPACLPADPIPSLDDGKHAIDLALKMAREESGDNLKELNIPVIAVSRDGEIWLWDWDTEVFEPTDRWGPFELIPAE